MDEELKGLLVALTNKVDALHSDVGTLKSDVGSLKSDVGSLKAEVAAIRTEHGQRLDRIDSEQRQMKEMLGDVWVKDIARLDGRIDQLAMDMALSRKSAATG